jgi:hypothetical protein
MPKPFGVFFCLAFVELATAIQKASRQSFEFSGFELAPPGWLRSSCEGSPGGK